MITFIQTYGYCAKEAESGESSVTVTPKIKSYLPWKK